MTSKFIVGVDECGWGAYAGPFTVGCAVYHEDFKGHKKIKDCKRFSSHNALRLGVEAVKSTAYFYAASAHFHATRFDDFMDARDRFMSTLVRDAISYIYSTTSLHTRINVEVIVDGEDTPHDLSRESAAGFVDVIAVAKADSLFPAVSAASIVAKYLRDEYMINISKKYPPEFKFESNKGYGTKDHIAALKKYGALDIHYPYIHDVQQAIKEKGYWNGQGTEGH